MQENCSDAVVSQAQLVMVVPHITTLPEYFCEWFHA